MVIHTGLQSGVGDASVGNFYVNTSVKDVNHDDLFAYLKGKHDAFVGPEVGGWSCYTDLEVTQDPGTIALHVGRLSEHLQAIAICVLNHDDDILSIDTFHNGSQVSEYNSCPGYFDANPSEERLKPRLSGAEVLAGLKPGVSQTQIREILAIQAEQNAFAIETHEAIVHLLGLPDYSVGFGYDYAAAGEFPTNGALMRRTFSIRA
ncbi:hypothetical protein [Chelativorans sp. M5D2P16]|uniref:hypothetical protein n=1 Tax=Chelativorans sp. M5D2P16 TaxID=3095678 RepID=UPI002ACAA81A|nr:hypothetical protein [Chelativorans sp. M5D2P16]MDZ5698722.1 hypothetical protein [Chelativorans sp. M5D2P16]